MLDATITVVGKIIILVLMMAVGFVCAKFRMITSRGASQITSLIVNIVSPCLIIMSFQTDVEGVSMAGIGITVLLTILGQGLAVIFSELIFRKDEEGRRGILRFAAAYSNCGFMGLPLVQAVVGDEGVVYASVYIVAQSIFVWTHGYITMSGGARENIAKKLLLNPGLIAIVIGLPLFAFQIQLPDILSTTMSAFSDLNTPLSMVMIGTYIAKLNFKEFFTEKEVYISALFRLVICPAAFLLCLLFIPLQPSILISCVIVASAPSAGFTVIFAAMFGRDTKLASKTMGLCTLLSVFTMPFFTVMAEMMAGIL